MADFQLELELTARIDDLEKGMKDAQRAVEKSSQKMETATKDAAKGGVTPLIEKLAKIGATLFLAEAAFKVGAAAARGFAGDTESMTAALKSIPIFGPLITSVFDFGDALEYASDSAFRARPILSSRRKNSIARSRSSRERSKRPEDSIDSTALANTQLHTTTTRQKLSGSNQFAH